MWETTPGRVVWKAREEQEIYKYVEDQMNCMCSLYLVSIDCLEFYIHGD